MRFFAKQTLPIAFLRACLKNSLLVAQTTRLFRPATRRTERQQPFEPMGSAFSQRFSRQFRLAGRRYVFSALPTTCGIVPALLAGRAHFWSAAGSEGSEAPRRFGLGARARPEPCFNTGARRKSKAPSPLCSAGALQNLNAGALNAYARRPGRAGRPRHPCSKQALTANVDGLLELGAWNFSGAWRLEFGAFVRVRFSLSAAHV